QIAALLSGDPQMAHAGQALQHQQEFGLTKAMEQRKQAEIERHNQASEPKVASDIFGRYNVHTGAPVAGGNNGAAGLLSPEAIDQQAQAYIKTGQLPSFGRANPALHSAIIQRAAEMSGGSDLATGRAGFHADTA